MKLKDLASDYDDLLVNLEDCNQALSLVWSWLNKDIDRNDNVQVWGFFEGHSSRLAVLNLVMDKLDNLNARHREIVTKAYEEG